MPLFRRKPTVPDWAPFEDPNAYERFKTMVEQAFGGKVHDGIVATPSGNHGVVNLAQTCAQIPEGEWPELVDRHVRSLQNAADLTPPESFDEARPLLRVRLVHPEFLESVTFPVAVHPLAEDLLAALVCDFPETVAYVREEDVQRWERPLADLLAIAIAATREREPAPELTRAGEIYALTGDSIYTASHALHVTELLPDESPHGVVLAVPNRHAILAHPIVDATVIQAINQMIPLAQSLCQEGPGSISDQLYWHRPDKPLTRLPVEGSDFFPPDEFVQVLNAVVE